MGLVRSFTIDDLIELPRRSTAVVNATGSYLLYTVTEFNQEKKERTGSLRLLEVEGSKDKILCETKDAQEPVFISDTRFLYLLNSNGKTTLKLYDIENTSDIAVHEFDGAIANLQYDQSTATIAFSAFVGENGKMMTAAEAKSDEEQDAHLYDKLFVRHWDAWKTSKRNSIFTSKLTRNKDGAVVAASFHNAILDSSLESPSPVFGSTADFSIFGDQLAFISKDPRVNPAYNTASQIWLQTLGSSRPPRRINDTKGASSSPRFSKDGKKLIYLQMNTAGYEAARNCIMIYDVAARESREVASDWDRSPSSIIWGADSRTILIIADDECYKRLFELKIEAKNTKPIMVKAAKQSVSEVTALANGRLFLSSSSIARAMVYTFIDEAISSTARDVHSGKIHGLSDSSTSTFWFDSADRKVQGLMVKPQDFDADKKYPMLFLIHGGPQGAWTDSWSTRWNPSVMANYGAGYIVIAVNPTGSTGYGQAFTDAIKGEWGSLPYDDLYNGFKFALQKFDFIDPERCAAAGGSYGGYMVNVSLILPIEKC